MLATGKQPPFPVDYRLGVPCWPHRSEDRLHASLLFSEITEVRPVGFEPTTFGFRSPKSMS